MKPLDVIVIFHQANIFFLTGGSAGQVDISSSHVDPKTTLLSLHPPLCVKTYYLGGRVEYVRIVY